MIRRRVKRAADGTFHLRLPAYERDLLRALGPQMRDVLVEQATVQPGEDPAIDRLFPVAYPTDEDRETEYRLLVHDELLTSHLGALAVLEETADAERLNEDQLLAWMRAINEIRLVLGTRLEISEEGDNWPPDPSDPMHSGYVVYDYLTDLQVEVITALSG